MRNDPVSALALSVKRFAAEVLLLHPSFVKSVALPGKYQLPFLRDPPGFIRGMDEIVLCFVEVSGGISMNDIPGALRSRDVLRRFERAARLFDKADFVHRHTANGIFERLLPMQVDARRILDLGSATGRDRRTLGKLYRGGLVIGVDRSSAMLAQARRARPWLSRSLDVQANAENLPFAEGSIDIVYANLLLPWIDDLRRCFSEIARVLRKDGLFIFSTLGPDSFVEIRKAWGEALAPRHVRYFPDMHDVGDGLVTSGLRDPVLDVDTLSLSYHDADRLFRDMRHTATGNSLRTRQQTLTGKTRIRLLRERLTNGGRNLPFTVTLELVYGHAWGGGPSPAAGERSFPVSGIGRRRR
jgi:malonyl-CoA O-methyltransferase